MSAHLRHKVAQIAAKLVEILASAGIGYALGRVQQRAYDEGRVGTANTKAEVNRAAALGAQQAHIDYLNQREKDSKP